MDGLFAEPVSSDIAGRAPEVLAMGAFASRHGRTDYESTESQYNSVSMMISAGLP
jgi:hypothetical protein